MRHPAVHQHCNNIIDYPCSPFSRVIANGIGACGNAAKCMTVHKAPMIPCIRRHGVVNTSCVRTLRCPPALRWGAPAGCQRVLPTIHSRPICSATGRAAARSERHNEQHGVPQYIIDVDAVLDVSEVLYHLAWHAAHALWPDVIVGSPSLFHKPLAAVMPALQQPQEAVVAVRLFVEEGIVGARSTAGRAGPVVGRSVRWGGSRPLNPVEIREDWPTVLTTCLIKWSRIPGDSAPPQPQQLMARIQQAYVQALAEHGALQLVSQRQRKQQLQQPAVVLEPVAVYQGPTAGDTPQLGLPSSSSSGSSVRQVPDAGDLPQMRAYAAASQAVARCSRPLWLASAHPAALDQALSAAAAEAGAQGQIKAWQELVTVLLPPPGDEHDQQNKDQQHPSTQQQQPEHLQLQQQLQQLFAGQGEAAVSCQDPCIHVIVSTPARLKQWRDTFATAQQQQQQPPPMGAAHVSAAADVVTGGEAPPSPLCGAAAGQQVPLITWHVSDWTCGDAAVQAQVLAAGGAELLSEAGLAELLGLGDVDVIMDGVAWRG